MTVTILNVDDTEIARYSKRRTLTHAGFDVIDAVTGGEALAILSRQPVPLVLLDVQLPDMSGIDVCRLIKSRWPNTMVLQTSANFTSSADRARGLHGGADAYVIQPIDADELIASIRALLRLYSAEESTRQVNASLEGKVADRTQALKDANLKLEEQIFHRIQAEAALVQAQKMEMVGQISGTMAHDFNNILASVNGYIHLARRITTEVAVKEQLTKALATSDRAKRLTERLLSFSRRGDMVAESVDVGRLVLDMHEWLSQSAGTHVQVHVDISDATQLAYTDANQLELAVLNLVINSRDAMPDGGHVHVAIGARHLETAIAELMAGHYVVIAVKDDGVGMPADLVSRAFEAFFTTKPAGRGTGLGLAQVQNLARLSGGAARMRSQPDQGTEVEIWLARFDPDSTASNLPFAGD